MPTQSTSQTELSAPFIQRIIQGTLERIRTQMKQNMSAMKRTTSGRSVASLQIVMKQNGGTLYGSKSWFAMERGRKGGRVPKNFRDIIRQWIIDKGIQVTPLPYKQPSRGIGLSPQERGLRSFAGAIAYTIMKKGSRLHRTGGFDNIYSSPIQNELATMHKELSAYVGETINTIHRTILTS